MNVQSILKTYQKNTKVEKATGKKGLETDKVEISSKAREMQVAMKALSQLPDVRNDKVEEIRSQMRNGKYKASAEDVVNKLLEGVAALK
ncbi:flagellar biosynthesis anti-sigma factor FlgM [Fusibacter sp. JL298sf-3]